MEKKPKVNLLDNGFTEIDGYIYTDKGSLIGKRNPDKLNLTKPDTQKESIGNFTDRGMIDRTPIQPKASQSQGEPLSSESGISTPPEQKEAVQQPLTFDQSFAQARQQGLSEFEFQGKRFNTKLKQDTPTQQPAQEPQEQPDITSDVTGKEGLENPWSMKDMDEKVQNFSQVMEIVDSVGQRNPDIDLEDSEAVLGAMTEQEQALWQKTHDYFAAQQQPQQQEGGKTGQAIGTTVKAAAGMTALYTAGKMYKNYKKRGGVFNFKDPNAATKAATPKGRITNVQPKPSNEVDISGVVDGPTKRGYREIRSGARGVGLGVAGLGVVTEIVGAIKDTETLKNASEDELIESLKTLNSGNTEGVSEVTIEATKRNIIHELTQRGIPREAIDPDYTTTRKYRRSRQQNVDWM